ncbi:MAG: sugar transferase [Verrucomicrobiota bacterium]
MNRLPEPASSTAPSSRTVPPKRNLAPDKPPLWKRFLDLSLLLGALPLLLPLMGLIALAIKLVSPGPVFFVQERVGYRCRLFRCYKFRTMEVDADAGAHRQHLEQLIRTNAPMKKLDRTGDPRLIPFAAVLRASGLDELPQLINVLRGEMSLVGPRPCASYELPHYRPSQLRRFDAVPGLTGLWQVSGKNLTTFTEMIAMDVYYAQHQSFWLDVKILTATFPAIVAQVRQQRARSGK